MSNTLLPTLAAFGAAAALSWVGVGRARALARARGVLDIPSERSSHTVPTPRGGGLGIVFAIVVCVLGDAWLRGDAALACAVVPVLAACAIGFADDRQAMSPAPKMGLLLLAAATALPWATVRTVPVPYLGEVDLGVLALPLSLFWLSCFSNAFNFMDGINGISGLTALVAGAAFAVAGVLAGDHRTAFLGAVAAGVGLGFLPWNLPQARIFMGDSGSLPLGMLLALVAAGANQPALPGGDRTLPFPAALLVLGPYLFDVAFTLVRRARERKALGQAHREHLYQRLARGLGSHGRSRSVLTFVQPAEATLALATATAGDLPRALSVLLPPLLLLASAPWVFDLEAKRSADPKR